MQLDKLLKLSHIGFRKINKKGIKKFFMIPLVCIAAFSCVSTKKQLILKDKSLRTVTQLQKMDTVLTQQPFVYKLKPGDIISINIASISKGEYDLSAISTQGNMSAFAGGAAPNASGYAINDSGIVHIPILGKVHISGLTLNETQALFQSKIDKILPHATVSIRMVNYSVIVLGEVSSQGPIHSPKDKLTVLDAIGLAGGFNDFANRAKIKRIRNVHDKTHISYLDISDMNLITSNDYYLLPNDVLIVEPLRAKTTKNYSIPNATLAVSSLSFILLLFWNLSNLFSL